MLYYFKQIIIDFKSVMPYIVALSGGVASGKTTIANLFAKLGVPVIDADVIAKQVVSRESNALVKIVKHFSEEILLPNGELDRLQLREIIFNNDHERLWLNHLLHPLIQQETNYQIKKQVAPYVLWVIPLLVENNLQQLADNILIIDTTPDVQLERLIHRDNIDETLAKKMILSQSSNLKRLSYANKIIKNSGSLKELESQVFELHCYYLKQSNNKGQI